MFGMFAITATPSFHCPYFFLARLNAPFKRMEW